LVRASKDQQVVEKKDSLNKDGKEGKEGKTL